jgi:hypothetical protein
MEVVGAQETRSAAESGQDIVDARLLFLSGRWDPSLLAFPTPAVIRLEYCRPVRTPW